MPTQRFDVSLPAPLQEGFQALNHAPSRQLLDMTAALANRKKRDEDKAEEDRLAGMTRIEKMIASLNVRRPALRLDAATLGRGPHGGGSACSWRPRRSSAVLSMARPRLRSSARVDPGDEWLRDIARDREGANGVSVCVCVGLC